MGVTLDFTQKAQERGGIVFNVGEDEGRPVFIPYDRISYAYTVKGYGGLTIVLTEKTEGLNRLGVKGMTLEQLKSLLREDSCIEIFAEADNVNEKRAGEMQPYLLMKAAVFGYQRSKENNNVIINVSVSTKAYEPWSPHWSFHNPSQMTKEVEAFFAEGFHAPMKSVSTLYYRKPDNEPVVSAVQPPAATHHRR